MFYEPVVFSADGRVAAIPERVSITENRFELAVRDLARPAESKLTGIELHGFSRFVLSNDGSRVAICSNNGTLSVYDLASNRMLSSVRVPSPGPRPRIWMFFRDANTVRAYLTNANRENRQQLALYEIDVARKSLRQLGAIPLGPRYIGMVVSRDGSRIMTRSFPDVPAPVSLYDEHGRALLDVTPAAGERVMSARLLNDGRVATIVHRGDDAFLRVQEAGGAEVAELPLGKGNSSGIAGEPAPGKLLVSLRAWKNVAEVDRYSKGWSTLLVDVATGRIERREPLLPTWDSMNSWTFTDPRAGTDDRPHLFLDAGGSLVRWEAVTGRKKVLVEL
jgi:hypothetical protein